MHTLKIRLIATLTIIGSTAASFGMHKPPKKTGQAARRGSSEILINAAAAQLVKPSNLRGKSEQAQAAMLWGQDGDVPSSTKPAPFMVEECFVSAPQTAGENNSVAAPSSETKKKKRLSKRRRSLLMLAASKKNQDQSSNGVEHDSTVIRVDEAVGFDELANYLPATDDSALHAFDTSTHNWTDDIPLKNVSNPAEIVQNQDSNVDGGIAELNEKFDREEKELAAELQARLDALRGSGYVAQLPEQADRQREQDRSNYPTDESESLETKPQEAAKRESDAYVGGVGTDILEQPKETYEEKYQVTGAATRPLNKTKTVPGKKAGKVSGAKKNPTKEQAKSDELSANANRSWYKKAANNPGTAVFLGGVATAGAGYALYVHGSGLQDKVSRAFNKVRSKTTGNSTEITTKVADLLERLKHGKLTKTDAACLAGLLIIGYGVHKASSSFGIYKFIANHKKLLLGAAGLTGLGVLTWKLCTKAAELSWTKEYKQFVTMLSPEDRAVIATYVNNLEQLLELGAHDPQSLKNNEALIALLSQEQAKKLDFVIELYHRQNTSELKSANYL